MLFLPIRQHMQMQPLAYELQELIHQNSPRVLAVLSVKTFLT